MRTESVPLLCFGPSHVDGHFFGFWPDLDMRYSPLFIRMGHPVAALAIYPHTPENRDEETPFGHY